MNDFVENLSEIGDFYKLLGVRKKSTRAEIRKAYIKLARKFHPDVNPLDKELEKKYKAVYIACCVLSDPLNRREYDELGHEAYISRMRDAGDDVRWALDSSAADSFESEVEILDEILYGGSEDKQPEAPREPPEHTIQLTFLEAVKGVTKTVKVEHEIPCAKCAINNTVIIREEPCERCGGRGVEKIVEKLKVKVPPGISEDEKIKVRGRRTPEWAGGYSGDLYLTPVIKKHPYFWRQGNDLFIELPVSYYEACLGSRMNVPTIEGWVMLTLPPGVKNGQRLRLKGRGIKSSGKKTRGDQYALIRIAVPEKLSSVERVKLEKLRKEQPFDPREGLSWEEYMM